MVNFKLKSYGTYKPSSLLDIDHVADAPNIHHSSASPIQEKLNTCVRNEELLAASSLDYTDFDLDQDSTMGDDSNLKSSGTKSKWKRSSFKSLKAITSKPSVTAAETKTSKLRAELHAKNHGDEDRIRNMEQKREIESLKRLIDEQKEKNTALQEKELKINDIIKARRFKHRDQEYIVVDQGTEKRRQEDFSKTQLQLDQTLEVNEQLNNNIKTVQEEKEQIEEQFNKHKMELKEAETTIVSLKSEEITNQANLDQIEKEKEGIRNLCKMYEEKVAEHEKERISIELENKDMLESLKNKCETSKELEAKLLRTETSFDEQALAMDDLIKLVSDLEFEKSEKEDELEKRNSDLKKLTEDYKQIENENGKLQKDLDVTSTSLQNVEKELQEVKTSLEMKESTIKNVTKQIRRLEEKIIKKEDVVEDFKEDELEKQEPNKSSAGTLEDRVTNLVHTQEEILKQTGNEISEKDSSISNLKTINETLKHEITNLKKVVDEGKQKVEEISNKLKVADENVVNIDKQLEESKSKHQTDVSKLIVELKNENEVSGSLSKILEAKTKEFLQERENIEAKFGYQMKLAEEEIMKKRKHLEEAEEKTEQLTADRAQLKMNIQQTEDVVKNQAKEIEEREINLRNEIRALKSQLEIEKSNSTERERLHSENMTRKCKEIEAYEQHSSRIEEQGKHQEKTLKDEIGKLMQNLDDLNGEKEKVSKLLENSEKERTAMQNDISSLLTKTKQLSVELEAQQQNMTSKEMELSGALNKLKAENEKLNREIENLQNEMKINDEHNKELMAKKEDEINRKEKALLSKIEENEIKDLSITSLNEKLNQSCADKMKLQLEIQDLQTRYKDTSEVSKNCADSLQEEIRLLKSNLHKSQASMAKIEEDYEILQTHSVKYIKDTEMLQREHEQVKLENQELFDDMNNKLNENEKIITKLRKERQNHLQEIEHYRETQKRQLNVFTENFDNQNKEYQNALYEHSEQIRQMEDDLQRCKEKLNDRESELKTLTLKYDEDVFQLEYKEKTLRDDNEFYLLQEINRMKKECQTKIIEVETEREATILMLEETFEQKCAQLEDDFEKSKSDEISALRREFQIQYQLVQYERDKLMIALGKAESIILQQRIEQTKCSCDSKEELRTKKKHLHELQTKYDDQNRVLEAIMVALEEERTTQRESKEILAILNKLERQFNDMFSTAKCLTISADNRSDSLLNDSNNSSLYSNDFDLNMTWPQTRANVPSPYQRVSSYQSLLTTRSPRSSKLKADVEKAKSEINLRLNDLEAYQNANKYSRTDLSKSPDILKTGESACSPGVPDVPLYSIIPDQWQTISNRLTDSGFTENSYQSSYVKSQLSVINDNLHKLERECGKVQAEDINNVNSTWLRNVAAWRKKLESRLRVLQNQRLVNPDAATDDLRNSFTRSIVYHPSEDEVNAIIDNVNRQYQKLKVSL